MHIITSILADTGVSPGDLPIVTADSGTVGKIMQVVFGIIGGFALLMIMVSGLRYVLSAGDPQKITRAKDGIIYALVGLAIAIAAESIVVFVTKKL